MYGRFGLAIVCVVILLPVSAWAGPLGWPVDCTPGADCTITNYTDLNSDATADCWADDACRDMPGASSSATYSGHEGTDISVNQAAMDAGVNVLASMPGTVKWVFDGYADKCSTTDSDDAQCQPPSPSSYAEADGTSGYRRCTESGPYWGDGTSGNGFLCFDGGNVVVIEHSNSDTGGNGLMFTRYDHLKKETITVSQGDTVTEGQKIAEVGDAGQSTGPHLHFEVWDGGYYKNGGNFLAKPWSESLWAYPTPWDATSIPTLSEWAAIVLALAVAAVFVRRYRGMRQ